MDHVYCGPLPVVAYLATSGPGPIEIVNPQPFMPPFGGPQLPMGPSPMAPFGGLQLPMGPSPMAPFGGPQLPIGPSPMAPFAGSQLPMGPSPMAQVDVVQLQPAAEPVLGPHSGTDMNYNGPGNAMYWVEAGMRGEPIRRIIGQRGQGGQ